ncbi:hypothetical protein X777_16761 [Ooceraea biroi]|uniref:Uncharacterized protein n=1 Tax=Ooceraea biroi TaxID=2015173 RepID=A0A026VVZ7_OOCBI|nr:hypothetical protein X777_16761 [Ooceraea biroi]
MSSKRRTFHVDWDSPSHETGTVKRRPTSLSASFSASANDRFENVEYYELRDCIDGYDLRRLGSIRSGSEPEDSIAMEDVRMKDDESVAIKSNENCSDPLRSSDSRKKSALRRRNDDPEKFRGSERARRARVNEQVSPGGHSTDLEVGKWRKDFPKHSLTRNRESCEKEIKDEADKIVKDVEGIATQDATSGRTATRKNFGLRLSCEPLEWKSTVCRVAKIRRSESLKSKSLIPRPKVAGSCKTRGLVSSSSESSGFGSPLSPLSPQQDPSISQERDVIRTSDSKSSGLGSPGSPVSPLSPESQKYSAFHLIQLQLEKLRNCSCEARQAKVIY